eukprot:SAG31_NODE_422_length_15859_cov_5.161865_10_plen_584_part_00
MIAPLHRTLTARNVARDLRRRVVGFQLLERDSPYTKQRRQFIVELDALVAMLYQERAMLASRMVDSPEEQQRLKEIQRWAQWAHVHCCHQPLYQQAASHGLWSAAAAGPPPAVQHQYPQVPASPPDVAGWINEAPPDPELVPLGLELHLDDGALSMLPTADEFGVTLDAASSVPVDVPRQEKVSTATASGKRRRTDRTHTDGVPFAPTSDAGPDDADDDQGGQQSEELKKFGEVAMATVLQLARLHIRNSPDTSTPGDRTAALAAASAEAKDELGSKFGPTVVVAATAVTKDATLEETCATLTPVEAFSAHLDRVEQLPVPCFRQGRCSSTSETPIKAQEVVWVREMIDALALKSDCSKDPDLEGRALVCLRARQWDVSSATELLRRYCLFRVKFGLGTARSREIAAPFLSAGVLRCAGGKDHIGRPIWHVAPGRLQQAFAGTGLSRADMVHHFVVAMAVQFEGLVRRYPEGQIIGYRCVWDARGLKPKLLQPAMLKFLFRGFTQLFPLRVESVVTLQAPWVVKKFLAAFFSSINKLVRIEHVKCVAELPGVLGCDSGQLDATLGGTRVYDHQAFVRFALQFS